MIYGFIVDTDKNQLTFYNSSNNKDLKQQLTDFKSLIISKDKKRVIYSPFLLAGEVYYKHLREYNNNLEVKDNDK